jgi:hypothetical protein
MTLILRSSGPDKNDFDVLDEDGRRVGRVYFDGFDQSPEPWRWVVAGTIAEPPPRGRATTRANALAALVQQLATFVDISP